MVVSEVPSEVGQGSEFEVRVDFNTEKKNTDYYLRAVFFHPEAATKYFGATFNGADWYSGKPSPIDHLRFLRITTSEEGSWSGKLKARVDEGMTDRGSGVYKFKVGRYTSGGSGPEWSDNEMEVRLVLPSLMPTATPTSKPMSTIRPTLTVKPTVTLKPTATSRPVLTDKPTLTVKPVAGSSVTLTSGAVLGGTSTIKSGESMVLEAASGGDSFGEVLGEAQSGEQLELEEVATSAGVIGGGMKTALPKVLVGLGMGMLGAAVYPAVRLWMKNKRHGDQPPVD